MPDTSPDTEALVVLTADIVSAHLSRNIVEISDIPLLIRNVHQALVALETADAAAPARPEPAVPVRASVKPDHIVCLEDGRKLKMLKRHLMTHYQLTPEEYRVRWGLPADYPMVAPAYAEQRRALAKKIGLGTRPRG